MLIRRTEKSRCVLLLLLLLLLPLFSVTTQTDLGDLTPTWGDGVSCGGFKIISSSTSPWTQLKGTRAEGHGGSEKFLRWALRVAPDTSSAPLVLLPISSEVHQCM